jgi:hypothetical protein
MEMNDIPIIAQINYFTLQNQRHFRKNTNYLIVALVLSYPNK